MKFFLFLLLLVPCLSYSQISVSASVARAFYNMEQLRGQQSYFHNNIPFDAKITDEYPAYYNFKGRVAYDLNDAHRVGIFAETMSTAARITYSDYSGSYYLDQTVTGVMAGALYQHHKALHKNIALTMGAYLGTLFTTHTIEDRVKLYDQTQTETLTLTSRGIGFEPSLGISYSLKFLFVESHVGYLINFNESLHLQNNRYAIYQDSNNKEIKANWSGLRIGLTAGVKFNYR